MWLFEISLPPSISWYEIHRYLWGYFPDLPQERRPFLFRYRERTALMLSRLPPAAPCVHLPPTAFIAGRCYQFAVDCSPSKKEYIQQNGVRHQKNRGIRAPSERRAWLSRQIKGAEVTFAEALPVTRSIYFKKRDGFEVCFVRDHISGVLRITDSMEFIRCLQAGIGRGKSWGMGLIYLPEVMQP